MRYKVRRSQARSSAAAGLLFVLGAAVACNTVPKRATTIPLCPVPSEEAEAAMEGVDPALDYWLGEMLKVCLALEDLRDRGQ